MHAAMRTQGISPTQKLVLVCLADHANADGLAYPSAKTISDETGLKDRAIRAALDSLYNNGIIRRASEPVNGAVQRWIVPDEAPLTPARNAEVFKEEPRHEMPTTPASNAEGGRHEMPETPARNADKATKKLPVETTKKRVVAADAAPTSEKRRQLKPAKPDKTEVRKALNHDISTVRRVFAELFAPAVERDAQFMGRNIQDALCYPVDDVTGTLRAIAARNPHAKTTGRTISLIDLGSWVAEWIAADRPETFPTAVIFRRSGESHDRPVSRLAASSQRIADAERVRAAREQWQAGGVAAGAG